MRERLNRLLRERTHMIAGIAHDLRTPLTRLSFRVEDIPAPLREKVQADIDEMKSMIAAALEFIRDRAQEGLRHPVDFRLLVESVVDDHAEAGRDVSFEAGPTVTLNCDPLALRLVAANLIDNALQYGKRARLRLRVAEHTCTLEVDDDGPGIPTLLQDQVFEPFFRAQGPRGPDSGGIGLGLTTVRSIVVDHGGEISLHNRPEGGLRVLVTLPVA
jgi:two-component system OmpR family sensor kinase